MASIWRKLLILVGVVVLLAGAGAPRLLAQAMGSIRGTVSDSSGAVIPGATVTATSTSTGISRTQMTNQDGIFVFPGMPIGVYNIEISKPGFENQKRSGTTLLTGQTLGLEISLKVGSAAQTVQVTSGAPLIQLDTSSVQTTVDQRQIRDLPLNQRNALQLTALTPGTTLTSVGTEATQQDNVGLSVNGLRATQDNYQLDGAVYTNRFFDSVPYLPNPDALQEFTIQSSNYSAEFGGAGALVHLSTRSGTNQLHGSAYEFFRNTVLNAKNYFQQTIPPFKLNQFGGTVGGPIYKDHTFFFFAAEDLQVRSSPNPISITVPTAPEMNGDFSALLAKGVAIYDPNTGLPYPGNKIPVPADPLSLKLYQKYLQPLPSNPTTGIYNSTANANIDNTQYLVKIDQVINPTNHLVGRYFYDQDNFQRPFNAPNGFFALNLFRNQSLIISDTEIFSPTFTGIFEASAGRFARTQIPEAPGLQSLQDLGQNVPLGSPGESIFPGIRANIAGFVNIFSGGALTQDATSFDYKASLVKVAGTHTVGFGAEFERDRIDMDDYSFTPGDNTFTGVRTQAPAGATLPAGAKNSGSAVADFYLGLDSQFFQDNGRKAYLREDRPSLYVQDDWRARKNLTLNLGLRWDPWLPPNDLNGTLVGFEPGFQSKVAPNAPAGLVFDGDQGLQASVFQKNWKAFAPRVGFAYDIGGNGKSVVRGAYGIFYGFPEGLLYQRTDATQPIDLYLNIPAPPAWDNIYSNFPGGSPFPRAHVSKSQFATYQFILPVSGGVLDPHSKVAYTQNYNLTFEQQLGNKTGFSLAYVGDHSEHIMGSRQFNPAVYIPGNCGNPPKPCSTVGNENSRRLYPGLGAMEIAQSYEYEEFNSLQANLVRRQSNGLTLLTNITWSKTIDNTSSATEGNTGPPNPFNLQSGRGPADFDQTIRYVLSANYVFPRYNVQGWKSALANNWQVNGILTLDTGYPFTVVSGSDRSLSGIGNDYADVVGNPTRPAGANRIQEWFNVDAFKPAATGTFGDEHRNQLRGPSYADLDLSVFKDIFKFSRVQGQFQAEAFNALNHTNLALPNASLAGANFGRITSTVSGGTNNNAGSPRVFQFAMKVLF